MTDHCGAPVSIVLGLLETEVLALARILARLGPPSRFCPAAAALSSLSSSADVCTSSAKVAKDRRFDCATALLP